MQGALVAGTKRSFELGGQLGGFIPLLFRQHFLFLLLLPCGDDLCFEFPERGFVVSLKRLEVPGSFGFTRLVGLDRVPQGFEFSEQSGNFGFFLLEAS